MYHLSTPAARRARAGGTRVLLFLALFMSSLIAVPAVRATPPVTSPAAAGLRGLALLRAAARGAEHALGHDEVAQRRDGVDRREVALGALREVGICAGGVSDGSYQSA